MIVASESIYEEYYDDLKIIDIIDFKSKVLEGKVLELQDYFDRNIACSTFNAGVLEIDAENIPSLLDREENRLIIYFNDLPERLLNASDKVAVKKISVHYDEECLYSNFSEYDSHVGSLEHNTIQECLSAQKECAYIACYSYYIYLKITLEEI